MGKAAPHPMQPIYIDGRGTVRFKANKIIEYLQNQGVIDLNAIALMNFPAEDRMQLAQLIGYSVSGFGDLSYARPKTIDEADIQARKLLRRRMLRTKKSPPPKGKEAT